MERRRLKQKYMLLTQGGLAMRQFIPVDDKVFRQYEMAGGKVSEQTRIEWALHGEAPFGCNHCYG